MAVERILAVVSYAIERASLVVQPGVGFIRTARPISPLARFFGREARLPNFEPVPERADQMLLTARRSEFDFDLKFMKRVLILGSAGELRLESCPLRDGFNGLWGRCRA